RQLQQLLGQHSLGLELPHLTSRSWREASQAVLSAEQQPVADLNQLLARDWIDLSPLDSGLDAIRAQQHCHNQLAAHLQQPLAEGISLLQKVDRLSQERSASLAQTERQRSEEHTSELQSRENLVCR